ncbi:HET domain-containing protein [Colletotrichum filicis]|nr:HET domain-containing protein [Colletotrichum filicis]
MSWAAGKKDTRGEDSSYALLGIFGVTLPIIYGEGKQLAFRNLQGAILDKTRDMSLFAWTSSDFPVPRGIFANSADEFRWFGGTKLAAVPFNGATTFAVSSSRDGVVIEGNCIIESEDTIFLDLGNGARTRRYDYVIAQRCGILIRRSVSGIYHRVQPGAIQTASAVEHAKAMRITIDAGDFTDGSVKVARFNDLRNSKTRTRSISNRNTAFLSDGNSTQDGPSTAGSPLQQRAPVDDSKQKCAGPMREGKTPTIEHQRDQSQEADQTTVKKECILDAITTGLDPDTYVEPSSARAVTPESLDDNTASSSLKAATATSAKQSFASHRPLADDRILVKSLARKAHKSFKTYQHITRVT